MELTKETKLSEILKEYPWMEDEAVKVETYNRVGIAEARLQEPGNP